MKADKQDWEIATANLRSRRAVEQHDDDNRKLENVVRDYATHLNKCGYGKSVLDVGCGSQHLKTCLRDYTEYIGIDAFPIKGYDTVKVAIENDEVIQYSCETVCAMAVLDNCQDFDKAMENIKLCATENVIVLTGIDIEVDEFHTFKLQLSDFDKHFVEGWTSAHREELRPKVWLLSWRRNG